jgi:hypothetical protein
VRLTTWIRSFIVVLSVYAAVLFGPSWAATTIVLMCPDQSAGSLASFSNNEACQAEVNRRSGQCFCDQTQSRLAQLYYIVLVPAAFALAAFFFCPFTFKRQLIVLNASIVIAGVAHIAYVYRMSPNAEPDGPSLALAVVIALGVAASILLGILHLLAGIRTTLRHRAATMSRS